MADPAPPSSSFTGKLVVLIDDHTLARAGTQALLASWGCRVIAAGSLQEALQRLHREAASPDALIVDYRLQNALGTDVIRAIRAELGADLPAVIITGDTDATMLANTAKERLAYVHKPVMPADLRNVVASLLFASG